MFQFSDCLVKVRLLGVARMPPEHTRLRFEMVSRPRRELGCSLRKVKFCGRPGLEMSNSFVRVTVIPELGGRVVEFVSRSSRNNQYYINSGALRRISPGLSWVDYGGYEENSGRWSGNFWRLPYKWKFVEESNDRLALLLWYRGEKCQIERRMTLQRGSTELRFGLSTATTTTSRKQVDSEFTPNTQSVGTQTIMMSLFFHRVGA